MATDPTKVVRSMSGLRDAMFDVLERVRAGQLAAKDAKEACNAARVILESLEVQMTYEASRHEGSIRTLPALPLTDPDGEDE